MKINFSERCLDDSYIKSFRNICTGSLTNPFGPSILSYRDNYNGKIHNREWIRNGNKHRICAPATVFVGNSTYYEWFNDGVFFASKEDYFHSLIYDDKLLCLSSEFFINF